MTLYDYAMTMEKEGETLYASLARTALDAGTRSVFAMLAAQEAKHYEIFKDMKECHAPANVAEPFTDTTARIFEEWQWKNGHRSDLSAADLYRRALEVEQKSIDFYFERSREVTDDQQKRTFLAIADEEKKHYAIIENLLEFITTPERWAENAEFTKLGQEY